MVVVDEVAIEQAFEIALAGRDPRLDGSERPLEGKGRHWIAPVQPGLQRPQHEYDTARKGSGIVFAQPKLDGVEGGIDSQWIDAVAGERCDRVGYQAFDFIRIDRIDAFEFDLEHRLP